MSQQPIPNPQEEPENNEAVEQHTEFDKVVRDAFKAPGSLGLDGAIPKAKTGVFGRIKVRKKEELGVALVQDIPLYLPTDFHQLYPINTEEGEGVVYTIKISLPAEKEEKVYIIPTSVVEEAISRVEANDFTFTVLTPQELRLGGTVRAYEMYPWVERSGRFGFFSVVVGMEDNLRSMAPYLAKIADIKAHQGQWVRRAGGVTYPAPPGVTWSPPKWPEELLNGNLDKLILRAYRGRIINSLNSDEAKWLAGLTGV